MTPSRMLRPALVVLAVFGGGLMTASCGLVEGADARRFEAMAQQVSDIHLDGSSEGSADRTVRERGLRPATTSGDGARLKVQVMDPHDLWDARDGGLRGAIEQVGSGAAETAAPVVVAALGQQVSARNVEAAPMRPAIARPTEDVPPPVVMRMTIQLGAYSSPEAARTAWAAVSSGAARDALKGLSPMFESVEVKGRPFTRLRVAAPAATAAAICQAAEVSDPWCARRA